MRVVPARAKLGSYEGVGLGVPRRKGTFGYASYAVLGAAGELSHSVPVNSSAIIAHRVLEVDQDYVAPVFVVVSTVPIIKEDRGASLPAYIVGPGNWPLIFRQGLSSPPSGLQVLSCNSKL